MTTISQQDFKKYLRPIVALIIIGVIVVFGWTYFNSNKSGRGSSLISSSNKQVKSQVITLNQTLNIPVNTGKPDDKPLVETFQKAQLTNQIVVNGQQTFSRDGTKFLMINLLVENDTQNRLNFLTKDTIRLIDPNNKKFAPSYFNSKTNVLEPDSVKKDVVGFLVPDNLKAFKIQYGPLNGDKQVLDLKFN